MMRKYKIYMIQNKTTYKAYIGQTLRTVKQRWEAHISCAKKGSKFRFHSAIRKYGIHDWDIKVLATCDTLDDAWEIEAEQIEKYKTFPHGYNATLGSTGGWIVGRLSPDKQLKWKKLLSIAGTGSRNPNYSGLTDEEIVSLGVDFYNEYGFICGLTRLVSYGKTKGVNVPKHFTPFRFGGDRKNLYEAIEKKTGAIYNPYHRDKKQRELLSLESSKWCWVNNGVNSLRINKEELNEYISKGYIRGRVK